MSHLLSPTSLPTQSSQQMAAPGTAVWQQRNPGIEGGPGQGLGQPRYKCQSRGHPRPSCWRLSVSLWLQDCVPRATRASGIIDLECRASYIPRIKTVLSFPIETKRAKSVFTPFPSARSFKWVSGQETSSRGCSLNKQTFPKFPSAIYIILLIAHFQPDPSTVSTASWCVCLSSKWLGWVCCRWVRREDAITLSSFTEEERWGLRCS